MNKWCLLILLLEVLSLASCNNDDADIPIDISNIKTNEVGSDNKYQQQSSSLL